MTPRPGTPEGHREEPPARTAGGSTVDALLTDILAELRAINAKLGELTEPARVAFDPGNLVTVMDSDDVLTMIEDMTHPGRGVIV